MNGYFIPVLLLGGVNWHTLIQFLLRNFYFRKKLYRFFVWTTNSTNLNTKIAQTKYSFSTILLSLITHSHKKNSSPRYHWQNQKEFATNCNTNKNSTRPAQNIRCIGLFCANILCVGAFTTDGVGLFCALEHLYPGAEITVPPFLANIQVIL